MSPRASRNVSQDTLKAPENPSVPGLFCFRTLERATGAALTEALRPVLGADAVLSTDGNACYWTVAEELKVASGYFVSAHHGKGGNGPWQRSAQPDQKRWRPWLTHSAAFVTGAALTWLVVVMIWVR